MTAESKRSFVRSDRYAIFELARQHDLSGTEQGLLMTLVLLAEWRTAEWRGHLYELAENARTSRKTVSSTLHGLAARGVVEIVKPFGKNTEGVIYVTVYDVLVVAEARKSAQITRRHASNDANGEPTTSDEHATNTEPIRNRLASNDASDQGEQGSARKRGSDEEGIFNQSRGDCVDEPTCEICGREAVGETDDGELRCADHRSDPPALAPCVQCGETKSTFPLHGGRGDLCVECLQQGLGIGAEEAFRR